MAQMTQEARPSSEILVYTYPRLDVVIQEIEKHMVPGELVLVRYDDGFQMGTMQDTKVTILEKNNLLLAPKPSVLLPHGSYWKRPVRLVEKAVTLQDGSYGHLPGHIHLTKVFAVGNLSVVTFFSRLNWKREDLSGFREGAVKLDVDIDDLLSGLENPSEIERGVQK